MQPTLIFTDPSGAQLLWYREIQRLDAERAPRFPRDVMVPRQIQRAPSAWDFNEADAREFAAQRGYTVTYDLAARIF